MVEKEEKLLNYLKTSQEKEKYLKDLMNKTNEIRVFKNKFYE